jgi:hypothetical protein
MQKKNKKKKRKRTYPKLQMYHENNICMEKEFVAGTMEHKQRRKIKINKRKINNCRGDGKKPPLALNSMMLKIVQLKLKL